MYYPYFRGKQFELLAIRDTANVMAEAGFTPIIEPVREALNGLERTLKTIKENDGKAIVIINPACGDHSSDGQSIAQLLKNEFSNYKNISVGILLDKSMTIVKVDNLLHSDLVHEVTFIHAGFDEPKALHERFGDGYKMYLFQTIVLKLIENIFRVQKEF